MWMTGQRETLEPELADGDQRLRIGRSPAAYSLVHREGVSERTELPGIRPQHGITAPRGRRVLTRAETKLIQWDATARRRRLERRPIDKRRLNRSVPPVA